MYYLADLTLVFLVIYVKTAFSLVPLEERRSAGKHFCQGGNESVGAAAGSPIKAAVN